ncbi:protocadherin 2 gamma 28 isoform X11 [Alosa sapidissima]|uniref:protocadherin 2 gamma 28 isoform X11 n=1 Tax=Alosa sapidissima TaxID=34773 RepID=UPI001C0A635F|nr:protocadherin 2 gamma 28 isoform X11 [Alosa sapidissima]
MWNFPTPSFDGCVSVSRVWKWQMRLFVAFVCLALGAHGQVRYSVPEEMAKGSLVGNIAQDLGLDVKRLKSGRARIFTEDSREYIGLNADKGTLVIKEKIDREELCAQLSPCSLHFQIILENPMELHRIDVEILDMNDNAPVFSRKEIDFQISESSLPGARYSLDSANDPDVGLNTLQSYTLNPTEHFTLKTVANNDGSKYVEMVLQTPLDREKQEEHKLILTAFDGGNPQKSGTVKINVVVMDANDNAPVFSQSVYRSLLPENSAHGTVVVTVTATDEDQGTNGELTYVFSKSTGSAMNLFKIDHNSGAITVNGNLDFEKSKQFQLNVEVVDKGGLTDTCKVIIELTDVNDNGPVISVISFSNPIPEDSTPETVIAMLNIKDVDAGKNGQVKCSVNRDLPFRITSSSSNFYSLVTDQVLDREKVSEYNITITAVDEGSPPLSTNQTITLKISDVNDNAPVFQRQSYTSYIMENNSPGVTIFAVEAKDKDMGNNARVSYFLDDLPVNGISASEYISVNAESGMIIAARSFDYEQIKELNFRVKAQDGGSPPLSSNVSVKIIIQDQNDNAPQILYPVQTSGSLVAEIVPRSADVGYLVTKVVAVDVDSGQNAWLSYKLQKATDRALFEVGAQNGEIRTIRQVTDKDAVKQKLTIVVEDNGQPSRSATVNVNVALADSFPEILSEFTDFTHDKEFNDNLTFYLVLALAVVSFLFIVSIIAILSVKCYRWRRERMFYKSNGNLPVIPYYPPLYADVGGTGTLQHVYNYDVYRTTDSRKSDLKYGGPCDQSIISLDTNETHTLSRAQREIKDFDGADDKQKPPNQDWRFNQNQRPGPSGAAATPEVAVGTGPWPNPPTEAEQLQALMAAANGASHTSSPPLYSSPRSCLLISEVSEATNTLTPGTMGLSTRYSPQFTLQHVPDYRQNVYIPGSTATLTSNPQQQQQQQLQLQQQMLPNMPPQQALPPAQATGPDGAAGGGAPGAQSEPPKAAQTPASKKKSTKKEKK